MKLSLHQVDAFTDHTFRGNPAAVVFFDRFPGDALLLAIAAENNLAETAYVVPTEEVGRYGLRWFTPTVEIDLCGHATLATAWVLFERRGETAEVLRFDTRSGELRVTRRSDGRLELDFPARRAAPCTVALEAILGARPVETWDTGHTYLSLFDAESDVARLAPDFRALARLDRQGIIVTARGTKQDFVSRYFASPVGVDEDPVTGSAHCALTPFWGERLGKVELVARQISRRGGDLLCRLDGDRVKLAGFVAPYLEGTIDVPDDGRPDDERPLT